MPYYDSFSCSHIRIIDKLGIQQNRFFSEYALNCSRSIDFVQEVGFDIVSAPGMNPNRIVSVQQSAYLTWPATTTCIICIFTVKNLAIVGCCFVKFK